MNKRQLNLSITFKHKCGMELNSRGLGDVVSSPKYYSSDESDDFCFVDCPDCQVRLAQCCYCPYNFATENNPTLIAKRKSVESYMKVHLGRCADFINFKRRKTNPPCDDVDVSMDYNSDLPIGDNDSVASESDESQYSESSGSSVETIIDDDLVLCDQEVVVNQRASSKQVESENTACVFTNEWCQLDLDPSDVPDNLPLPNKPDSVVPGFEMFEDMYDTRRSDKKVIKRGGKEVPLKDQNSAYMFQRYQTMSHHDGNDQSGGFAGLAHRASIENREDISKQAPPNEARQIFRLLRLLLNLPGKMKDELIDYQKGFFDLYQLSSSQVGVEMHFPLNMKDTRRMILDGAHSVMKNFPTPKIREIGNHACVSLLETIRIMAGHGAKFGFKYDGTTKEESNNGLNGTEAMNDLVEDVRKAMTDNGSLPKEIEETSIGWIYLWSDSFLRCFIKQKENSVWILTVTICPPGEDISSGLYTHVLAMGKSSEDHTPVREFYLEEMMTLMKGFKCYHGEVNKIINVAFGNVTIHADRPERHEWLNTRKEGTYGKVSGYAVNISEERFPACRQCYRNHVLDMLGNTNQQRSYCRGHCLNWTLDPSSPSQKTDEVGQNYPKSAGELSSMVPEGREPGVDKIGPVKLSEDWLRMACTLAYEARRTGLWTKANLTEYLRTCNVKGSRIEIIDDIAETDKRKGKISKPEMYLPKVWWLIGLFHRFRFPNLPMHALFHGMIPDFMDIVHHLLSHQKRFTNFCAYANSYLDEIASFGLDWCKVKQLPKAAWVAENCLGYTRLISFLYGGYLLNFPLNNELREHVDNLKRMLNALQALMSILMSKDAADKTTIDNHMKLLMSAVHYFHKMYGHLGRNQEEGGNGVVGRRVNGRKKKVKDLVDNLSSDDLRCLSNELDDLGMDDTQGLKKKRQLVRKYNKKQLQAALKARDMNCNSNDKKSDLQSKLFGRILSRPISSEGEPSETDATMTTTNPKSEKMCWNKGNWLSFLAVIGEQVEYLGSLRNIW